MISRFANVQRVCGRFGQKVGVLKKVVYTHIEVFYIFNQQVISPLKTLMPLITLASAIQWPANEYSVILLKRLSTPALKCYRSSINKS